MWYKMYLKSRVGENICILKNLQKGMRPNGPTSLRNIILLEIDSFYYEGGDRLHSQIKTLLLIELEF